MGRELRDIARRNVPALTTDTSCAGMCQSAAGVFGNDPSGRRRDGALQRARKLVGARMRLLQSLQAKSGRFTNPASLPLILQLVDALLRSRDGGDRAFWTPLGDAGHHGGRRVAVFLRKFGLRRATATVARLIERRHE
jgi:hypothetical protein